MGGGQWRLARLPGPGSIREQEAWLMHGLQIVAATRNALVAESLAEGGRARHEDD